MVERLSLKFVDVQSEIGILNHNHINEEVDKREILQSDICQSIRVI